VGPLLLAFPVHTEFLRLLAVFGFCMLHMGFGSCLNLGLFMWIPQVPLVCVQLGDAHTKSHRRPCALFCHLSSGTKSCRDYAHPPDSVFASIMTIR
jgi:hypothetical protein